MTIETLPTFQQQCCLFRSLCDSLAAAEGETTPPGEMEQEEKEMMH